MDAEIRSFTQAGFEEKCMRILAGSRLGGFRGARRGGRRYYGGFLGAVHARPP